MGRGMLLVLAPLGARRQDVAVMHGAWRRGRVGVLVALVLATASCAKPRPDPVLDGRLGADAIEQWAPDVEQAPIPTAPWTTLRRAVADVPRQGTQAIHRLQHAIATREAAWGLEPAAGSVPPSEIVTTWTGATPVVATGPAVITATGHHASWLPERLQVGTAALRLRRVKDGLVRYEASASTPEALDLPRCASGTTRRVQYVVAIEAAPTLAARLTPMLHMDMPLCEEAKLAGLARLRESLVHLSMGFLTPAGPGVSPRARP